MASFLTHGLLGVNCLRAALSCCLGGEEEEQVAMVMSLPVRAGDSVEARLQEDRVSQ